MATAAARPPPANFIDTDEEPVLELSRYINLAGKSGASSAAADLSGGELYTECAALLESDPSALLAKYMEFVSSKFTSMNGKDMEGCMQCVFLLLRRVDSKTVGATVTALCALLTASKKAAVERVQILCTLYNQLEFAPPCRFEVFSSLLDYCADTKDDSGRPLTEAIVEQIENLDQLAAQWKCPQEKMTPLLWKAVQLLEKSGNAAKASSMVRKLLGSAQGAAKATLEGMQEIAVHACVQSIRSLEVFTFDELLDFDAVKALKDEKQHAKLYTLVDIFVCKKLADYMAFAKANKAYVAKVGLEHEACVDKMRLLTLTSLATQNAEVSYAEVAANLLIGEDEVEEWVIRAISEELIEARMNQLLGVVMIIRSTQRQFDGEADWKMIESKLDEWQQNVARMAMTVESATPRGR